MQFINSILLLTVAAILLALAVVYVIKYITRKKIIPWWNLLKVAPSHLMGKYQINICKRSCKEHGIFELKRDSILED